MTEYLIFQSSKRNSDRGGKARSDAIAADNVKARAILERAGWTVVERFEREDDAEPTASNRPRIAQEALAVEQDDSGVLSQVKDAFRAARGRMDEGVPEEVTDTTEVPEVGAGFDWDAAGVTDAQHKALFDAGFGTEDALNAATDAELQAVPGIGAATVRNIRKALKSEA